MPLNLIYLIVIKSCTPQAYSNRLLDYRAIAPDRTGVTKSGGFGTMLPPLPLLLSGLSDYDNKGLL